MFELGISHIISVFLRKFKKFCRFYNKSIILVKETQTSKIVNLSY